MYLITFNNKIQSVNEWATELGIHRNVIYKRLRRGIINPVELFAVKHRSPIPYKHLITENIMQPDPDFTTSIPNSTSLFHKGDNAGPKIREMGRSIRLTEELEIVLTRERAAEHLKLKRFIAERTIKTPHVAYLQRCLIRGTFRPEQVLLARAYCQEDKQTYRINGQHTCLAIWNLPDHATNCTVRLFTYTCKTLDDIRALYGSFDRAFARSQETVVSSIFLGKDGYEKYSRKYLSLIISGFSMWKWESSQERNKYDVDSRCHMLDTEYGSLAHRILDFYCEYDGIRSQHIRRAPVVAAMFETFQKSQAAAKSFWEAVTTGVGFENNNDPRLVLRSFLDRTAVSAKPTGNKKVIGQEGMYRACIAAWNKLRAGEELSCLQPNQVRRRQRAR
jgi:hypothetical protein